MSTCEAFPVDSVQSGGIPLLGRERPLHGAMNC